MGPWECLKYFSVSFGVNKILSVKVIDPREG